MTIGRLRFQLELELARDPIEGCLSDEHGETIRFIGWLELISVLEQALAGTSGRRRDENESAT